MGRGALRHPDSIADVLGGPGTRLTDPGAMLAPMRDELQQSIPHL
ncbi:hypothetical protein AB0P36_34925 [Streptomyces flavidovirens]